ncbi:uncharacterized protein LOC130939492 [Arachis stenosperma]|uniref:uncharacterized protein LOC130939492 n=1 Tax=Arachis stenosperma TaxID=217475 RepID=UPI0025ABBFCC|nr:uncharacterized protein LOC130939492 [Arachis stenosperma]
MVKMSSIWNFELIMLVNGCVMLASGDNLTLIHYATDLITPISQSPLSSPFTYQGYHCHRPPSSRFQKPPSHSSRDHHRVEPASSSPNVAELAEPDSSFAAPETSPSPSSAASTSPTTQSSQLPPPSPPPTTSGAAIRSSTKKRPLESDSFSNYYKIRALIPDLRPHFIQVLRTPDYKSSKESREIREQLKIVVKLYEDMKAEAVSLAKYKQDGQNLDHKTQQEQQPQHMKSPEQIQVEKSFTSRASSEIKVMALAEGQGTYVVGGSAFGWNFITFSGEEAVYYGRTKEQFRSTQVRTQPGLNRVVSFIDRGC